MMIGANTKNPGTYVLRFRCGSKCDVVVGRIGLLALRPGEYLYVGSAMGAGGLHARVAKHMHHSEKNHWHIDYIKPYLYFEGAWLVESSQRLEHRWAKALQALPQLTMPQKKFGASDCGCESHLFYAASFAEAVAKCLREASDGERVVYYSSEQLQILFSG